MSGPRHVVGIVGNDIINDSRVKKVAASAAAAGFKSTILCYTPTGTRRKSRMGAVEVIRVPIVFAARDKNGRIPNPLRPFNGDELATRHAGPRTHLLARRRWLEAGSKDSDIGTLSRLRNSMMLLWTRGSLKIRHEAFRVRRKAHVESDRIVRALNKWRVRTTSKGLRFLRDPIPNIADYEVSFGSILDELKPDIIHAHDFHMIGVAVSAATRLKSQGHVTRVVYDAHEWIPGLSYPETTLKAWLGLQGRYIRLVDAVVGVSPEQIDQLVEMYSLGTPPTLVLNAPVAETDSGGNSDVRKDLGIDGPIITYHGNIPLERGLETLIEALPLLPDDVHLAILAPANNPNVNSIVERSSELQVRLRVHILDYVPAQHLPEYLSTANVSVIPYLKTGNNEIALPNKLFESVQAALPVVVSDMRSLSRVVAENGIGEVFEAGSPSDLAAKVMLVLENRDSYTRRINGQLKTEFAWQSQARRLTDLYARLLDQEPSESRLLRVEDTTEGPETAEDTYRPTRLAVGPRNMAGQAFAIANAVQSHLGVPSMSIAMENPKYRFPTHIRVRGDEWRNPTWQEQQLKFLADGFTHILSESGTGMLGSRNGGFIDDQLIDLRRNGLKVGVVLHGSEIRDPQRHRALPHSPYAVNDDLTRSLEQAVIRLRSHLRGAEVPIFVTTPDLLDDIEATWLPVTLGTEKWSIMAEPSWSEIPTILHLPTNSRLKGSEYVDPVLRKLESEGLIRYLRPTSGSTSKDVPALVEKADIVVDQIVIGAYGLMSCQVMAAGRLSIANIRDIGFLSSECPVIDANPDTLEAVLRDLLTDRSTWKPIVEAGKQFVKKYHNGEATAKRLEQFLNGP